MSLPSSLSSSCNTWYEWSTAGTIGGRFFSGSEPRGVDDHLSFFDTPLFRTLDFLEQLRANNATDLDAITPGGRIMGAYWPSGQGESFLASGLWNFHFFATDSDDNSNIDGNDGNGEEGWLSANLGFGVGNTTSNSPAIVTGGSGSYLGAIGRIQTMAISSDPFIIQYEFCSEEAKPFDTSDCKDVFEWSSFGSGEIDGESFSGSVLAAPHTGVANTPIFGSKNVESSPLTGRLVAQYFLDSITTASGSFNFQFFPDAGPKDGNDSVTSPSSDAVSINFGFGPLDTTIFGSFTRGTPNIIVGGTGAFAGLVGSMRDRAVNSDPLVFNYQICPSQDAKPAQEVMNSPCRKIYEWSTGGEFDEYRFSGSVEYDGGAIGVFDTPFFDEPDVANANVSGRVMGYYVPNKAGSVAGKWNFAFFDNDHDPLGDVPTEHEDWIAASLGFYQDGADKSTQDGVPNIIIGGSGAFAAFSGTITSNVISSDPFVIQWEICPPGAKGGDAASRDEPMDGSSASGVIERYYHFLLSLVATVYAIWSLM